jgi:transcriptional regulator EpsA
LAEFSDQRNGLMARAIDAWHKGGEEPLAIYPTPARASQWERFRAILERHALANFVMHGTRSIDERAGAYFILAGIPHAFGARHNYLLQLMLPYLSKVLERTLKFEQRQQVVEEPRHEVKRMLTEREISILQLVQEGKSNKEIGAVLNISSLTVKNHVQNTLKKLKAQNRAQAVSRGLSLKLLK